jgi:hypothetical protein
LANSHRCNNFIGSLKSGDTLINDQTAIKKHIEHFYTNLYKELEAWRPKLDEMPFNSKDSETTAHLECHFEV